MRECGECDVCCYVANVESINKPPYTKCPHLNNGCSLFNKKERPGICKSFYCAWAREYGNIEDRPDKNGLMVSINTIESSSWIFVIELKKDAAINAKNIIFDIANKIDLPIIVSDFGSRPPNDRGDRTIIKKSLLNKTKKMRGELLDELNDDVGIYKLKTLTRECGECTACCSKLEIDELYKPVNVICYYLKDGKCSMYDKRPKSCVKYFCKWRMGTGKEEDRPDKSGFIVDSDCTSNIENSLIARPLWKDSNNDDLLLRFAEEEGKSIIQTDFHSRTVVKIFGEK